MANEKQVYTKLIENTKARIHDGVCAEEVVGALTASKEKVPDFVYSMVVDTYFDKNRPEEALNILISVS